MSDIKRYDSPVGYMNGFGDGEYVLFTDHEDDREKRVREAVQAERARCRLEEVEPLKVHPDPGRMRLLADWFDAEQQRHPERWEGFGVQADFRLWADRIESALAAIEAKQK